MRLFIAEKPSLARAIAEADGAVKTKDKLSVTMQNGDVICWSAGHILRTAAPEEISPEYKQWTLKTLPIIPSEWKLVPSERTKELLDNIGKLLKKADVVVHAGDADREGQLLIDEILDYFNYKGKVLRVLVTDMNKDAVKKALDEMKGNENYKDLMTSALARQRADWLLGINMTRLFTVTTPRERGEVLSVGRVQTPTLALVVERDREIENFTPSPYYVVKARCVIRNGEFQATWKPNDDAPCLDAEGRITDKSAIDALEKKLKGHIGNVTRFKKGTSLTQPPLTYSLPTLQIDASKAYGISPDKTLEILQSLYEAKYATYPRSDCGYLPESLYENREKVVSVIKGFSKEYEGFPFDMSLKSGAWNTAKTAEHHGVIPTGTPPVNLNDEQKEIFDLIARRYAAQFLPAQEFASVEIEVTAHGELFAARSRRSTSLGWRALYTKLSSMEDEEEGKEGQDKEEANSVIPDAEKGEEAGIREIITEEKKTSPPKRFTEASLLSAMNNIHKYVKDAELKKILKETLGIGTAATQAKIIKTLIDGRGYIEKEKKVLVSTAKGRALIDAVDEILRKPDTTALWEQELGDIAAGKRTIEAFIGGVVQTVKRVTEERAKTSPETRAVSNAAANQTMAKCPSCGEEKLRQLTGKFGKFWVCGACGVTLPDEKGRPAKSAKCPACGSLAVRIKGKNGFFWGCRNKECKKTFADDKGKLARKKTKE